MHAGSPHPAMRFAHSCLMLGALALATIPLVGCNRAPAPEAKKHEEKKAEPPFEAVRVFVEPNELSSFVPRRKETRRILNVAKPGHWAGILVQTKANTAEFAGELYSTAQTARRSPMDLEHSPYWLSTKRSVALPKGQRKQFESLFFPPPPPAESTTKGSTWIGNRLTGSKHGIEAQPEPISHMPSYQYHMVVLAPQASRYRYLTELSCVRPRTNVALINPLDRSYYRVEYPDVGAPLALPSHPLCWTSIAYIVWDDVLPGALSPEQQRALIDWLHWGGGLIVSGPDSLDKLAGSFLADYLPATAGNAGPIDAEKLARLHEVWNVKGDESQGLAPRPGLAISGVELVLHPDAAAVPNTVGLLAERRVGRGRVLVTAFRLSEPELVTWRSFDSLFNACLLGRPRREHEEFVDRFQYVATRPPDPFDARLVSGVRFFSRDVPDATIDKQIAAEQEAADEAEADAQVPREWQTTDEEFRIQFAESELIDQLKGESGVGGWSDFSPVSDAARHTLRDAAGISVPKRSFVLKMIGLYLIVVVPVNWLVFRLLGKVEWAWVAVPVISLCWGVMVVWAAQLDIGFARSETEVAVLELQPGYDRGHLTRYTALYSSLSTQYDLALDDPSSLALPFASEGSEGMSSRGVTFKALDEHALDGYTVASNSTGMIHSEQMCATGGKIEWDAPQGIVPKLTNGTRWKLGGAVVLARTLDAAGTPVSQMAWLGDLEPGATIDAPLEAFDADALAAHREAQPRTALGTEADELTLGRLLELADDCELLEPGEVRLVAWYDGRLDGIHVRPSASQSRAATLAVAHLAYGPRREPRPDVNLRPLRPDDGLSSDSPSQAASP